MHNKTCNVVPSCFNRLDNTQNSHRARSRPAEQTYMQSHAKSSTSPPTARVWVNAATWSPDVAKKRTLSLNAAERGILAVSASLLGIFWSTASPLRVPFTSRYLCRSNVWMLSRQCTSVRLPRRRSVSRREKRSRALRFWASRHRSL